MKWSKNSNRRQLIGLHYSPSLVADPDLVEPYIKAAADKHYAGVIGFVRHMHQTVFDAPVVESIRRSVEFTHKHGMKYVLDMDPFWWGQQVVEQSPDAAMSILTRVDVLLSHGRFQTNLAVPAFGQGQRIFQEIAAAYWIKPDNSLEFVDPKSLDVAWEYGRSLYALPSYDQRRLYDHYRPINITRYVTLSADLGDRTEGKLVLYPSFAICDLVDMAHDAYLQAQRRVLDLYRGIELDGVSWDEPGKDGSSLQTYKAGQGFFKLFTGIKGYDLKTKMIYLDDFADRPESVKIRRDYFEMLGEMIFGAQLQFNTHAKTMFGEDIMLGTHHTWSGMTMDLRGGCIDYFKLARNHTAGFTDCNWSDFRMVVYNYMLLDGIRKERSFDLGYCDDWSGVTTDELMRFYTRLKLLFRINWFNIFLGEYSESLPNYPQSRFWSSTGECVDLLDEFNQFIGSDFQPHTEVAIWHGWEALAYLNNDFVKVVYTGTMNMCAALVKNNCHADFVSSEALENASVSDGNVTFGDRHYRAFVLPHACALSQQAWARVQEMVEKGVHVVFTGLPPRWVIESGQDLGGEFCRGLNVEPFSLNDYITAFRAAMPSSGSEWEPATIDFTYPVNEQPGTDVRKDADGRVYSVRGSGDYRNMIYLPAIDAGDGLVTLLSDLIDDGVHFIASSGFYRIYRQAASDDVLLVIVADIDQTLACQVQISSLNISVDGGTWIALKIAAGKVVDHISDPKTRWVS